MSWYEFLLFVHITAAVIWLGGAFAFQMSAAFLAPLRATGTREPSAATTD
jgi:uncharacterized membrane protein